MASAKSETATSRAVVDIVAALAPVESAIRITGSSESVAVVTPSLALLTADFGSVGQLVFCAEVERSRVSCARASCAGAHERIAKSSKSEMNFGAAIMMKGDEPGERAGDFHLTTKTEVVDQKNKIVERATPPKQMHCCLEAGYCLPLNSSVNKWAGSSPPLNEYVING